MNTPPEPSSTDAGLNPALRAGRDESHGTSFEGTDPMKTVSVQDAEEGSSWPAIWAWVTLAGVLVTIYLIVT